jgi:hypothetical protein
MDVNNGDGTDMIVHIWGLLFSPAQEWQNIHDKQYDIGKLYLSLFVFLALIPPLSGYIGTTQIGFQIGLGEAVKLSHRSALAIAVLYYLAILVGIGGIGAMIHWMARTYGSQQPLPQCIALAAFAGVPLLLVGIVQLYPVLWLNLLFGMAALGLNIRLLYLGVPVMMEVPPERGFLFASAILGLGMVALVAFLAGTAILWDFGLSPEFVR